MSKYLISIDGGASKTDISVYDNSDGSVAMFEFDASNYQVIGAEKFEQVILGGFKEIFEMLEITSDDILGIVAGLAGCDGQKDKEVIVPIMMKIGVPREKLFICNDSELIMYSLANAPGICIVSGTGSICFGYDQENETVRCGGWGAPLSDLGSGYWIGMQILREYIKYTDDQVPHLPIYDEVQSQLGKVDFHKLGVKEIASTAQIVIDYAESGNELCRNIIDAAAYNLAQMCATVFRKLYTNDAVSIDLIMTGGLFQNDTMKQSFMAQCVRQTNYDNFNFIIPSVEPAECGIELAKKLFTK